MMMTHWWTAIETGDAVRVRDLLARRWWRKAHGVQTRDPEGWTPLHVAARAGSQEVVALLLAHGADVHARGPENWTPLQPAVANSHHEVVEMLLAHGADVNARGLLNWTPLTWALVTQNDPMYSLLKQHGGTV